MSTTDQVLASNEQSQIFKTLANSQQVDLSYNLNPSFPILTKKIISLIPSNTLPSGDPSGVEITFILNKSMLLSNLALETVFTIPLVGTNKNKFENNSGFLGLNLFSNIEIRTSSRVLARFSPQSLRALAEASPPSLSYEIFRRAMIRNPTTGLFAAANDVEITPTTTYKVCTPIFCSWFDSVINNLNTNTSEPITIAFRFNSYINMGLAVVDEAATPLFFNAAINVSTMNLFCYLWTPNRPAYDALVSKNNNPSRPLNMLYYSTFTESLVLTGATSTSIRLYSNYPAFKSFVMIMNTSNNSGSAQINFGNRDLLLLENVTFTIGGSDLFTNIPVSNFTRENVKDGLSSVMFPATAADSATVPVGESPVVSTINKVVPLNWGLLVSNVEANSGGLSFSNLNSPTITVTYPSVTPANYTLFVIHQYWQIASYDASNGLWSIATAS